MITFDSEMADVSRIRTTDAVGAGAVRFALDAAEFLGNFTWGGFREMRFAFAVDGIGGWYVARVDESVEAESDHLVWVAAGNMPGAYFVGDDIDDPLDAIDAYAGLLEDWILATKPDGAGPPSKKPAFPFRIEADADGVGGAERIVAKLRAVRNATDDSLIMASRCRLAAARTRPRAASPIGMLVATHCGELGICIEEAEQPDGDWLAMQRDARFREHATGSWFKVFPLVGGSMCVPAPLMTIVGEPGPFEVELATRCANAFAERRLQTMLGL